MRFAFACFIATLLVFSFWSQASAAGFSVNTYIISGPKEGEALDETNQVVFRFTAWVYPKETEGQIMFETKIIGFDEDWKETSSQDRVVELPAGPKEYTFFVRAKIGKIVDPTPAKRTFKISKIFSCLPAAEETECSLSIFGTPNSADLANDFNSSFSLL